MVTTELVQTSISDILYISDEGKRTRYLYAIIEYTSLETLRNLLVLEMDDFSEFAKYVPS